MPTDVLHLLVLEDEPNDAELEIAVLEAAGYRCQWERVETRKEFLARLDTPNYDLILSDFTLPSFDGLTALQLVLERNIDIPFILVSGQLGEETAIDSLKAGATDYVLKNHLSRLPPVVRRALKGHTEQRQRKQAERDLQESEKRYRRLVDNSPDGIAVHCEGEIVYASAAMAQIFGGEPEDILGKSILDFVHPDFFDVARDRIGHILTNKETVPRIEEKFLKLDGTIIDVDVVSIPFFHNEKPAVQIVVRDITVRKRAEKEREQLMSAVEQAAEAIVITDVDGAIQYANPACERVTGYTRWELIGQNPRLLKSDKQDAAFYQKMWDTLIGGETWSGRFINKRKDGTLFTEEATISPMRNAAGQTVSYVAVKRNITKEIELENQLREAQKMEAVGQLAGGVAHDFNNLLQAVLGYGVLAMDDAGENDSVRSSVGEILKAGRRAKTLVSQLVAFSRRQVLEMTDVAVNTMITDIEKMLQHMIGQHIALEVLVDEDVGFVHADQGQVERILVNLCVNARDAMPDGGKITIETENVQLDGEYCQAYAWAKPGSYARLSVTDTGHGMDEDTLGRIFEPFFTTKAVGQGTGLGLSSVYGLVQQHQGILHVYSEVGKGTTFKIYLPLVEPSDAPAADPIEAPSPRGTETILLAEDDEMVRNLALRVLQRAGYTVYVAMDGLEAVEVFQRHADKIGLSMLDVVMPKLNGIGASEQIRTLQPGARVLFCSGYSANQAQVGSALEQGMELIQKPYAPETLLRKIRELLDT